MDMVPALLLALIWALQLIHCCSMRPRCVWPVLIKLAGQLLDLKLAQLQNVTAGYIDAPDDIMAAEAASVSQWTVSLWRGFSR